MKKNKLQIAIGIVSFGFLVGVYEFYDFWENTFPLLKAEQEAKETQVAGLENEVRKLQTFVQNVSVIKQEFRELNLQLEAALEHMPRTFNFASLLRKLTMLAENSGVSISSFRPKKETVQRRGDPGQTNEVNFYETIFVEFSLQGSFTQTMVFFDQLSRLKRIVNIESVKLTARRDPASKSFLSPMGADVTIKTYRFSE